MLKTLPSQQRRLNWFRLASTFTPLIGVTLLAAGMPVEARPILIQQPTPTTQIYGSPIPSPVPLVSGTTTPYSLSPYTYPVYNPVFITPRREVIRNSTLINPTIINSRISDSVLINPVIINSPRFPYGTVRPPVFYNPPGIRIRIEQ